MFRKNKMSQCIVDMRSKLRRQNLRELKENLIKLGNNFCINNFLMFFSFNVQTTF